MTFLKTEKKKLHTKKNNSKNTLNFAPNKSTTCD